MQSRLLDGETKVAVVGDDEGGVDGIGQDVDQEVSGNVDVRAFSSRLA